MLMGKWQKDMKSRKIPFTANLNVTGMLVDGATVSECILDYKARAKKRHAKLSGGIEAFSFDVWKLLQRSGPARRI